MIDKQDAHEGALDTYSKSEKSKAPSVGRDTFPVTPRTETNMNYCQTQRDTSKSRSGTSPRQETDFGLINMNLMGEIVAANGHHESVLAGSDIQENGYGSPPDKQGAIINRDMRHCQYEHSIHRERPKTFATPMAADSLPKGNGSRAESDGRQSETWKTKDPRPTGGKDCSKTGKSHSEVTKIVPLKPQRSKKSLTKENKGAENPPTQSQADRGTLGGDAHMIKSKDRSCEAGRREDGDTVLLSATDDDKENRGATKHHSEAAMSSQQQQTKKETFGQQELRDSRGTTGQSQRTRGGTPPEDHSQSNSEFKENLHSSSKVPTVPPRTLPLKTQWSRDRQSNMDNSHIHYRTPSQETAKRKQAVNHLPPPLQPVCPSSESKTLHELQAMPFKSCFCH